MKFSTENVGKFFFIAVAGYVFAAIAYALWTMVINRLR